MEDKREEIFKATKTLAGITTTDDDELLLLLIDEAIAAVAAYCRLDILPRQLESFIPVIAAREYTDRAHSGVRAVSEGERRVDYADAEYDFLNEYSARLKPFISRSVKLPSDLECDSNESV